jgi:hypothetical protein
MDALKYLRGLQGEAQRKLNDARTRHAGRGNAYSHHPKIKKEAA